MDCPALHKNKGWGGTGGSQPKQWVTRFPHGGLLAGRHGCLRTGAAPPPAPVRSTLLCLGDLIAGKNELRPERLRHASGDNSGARQCGSRSRGSSS